MFLTAYSKRSPYWVNAKTKLLLRVMKLSAFFLSICISAFANGFAQNLTISEKDASIEKIFNLIESQTDYVFFYDYPSLSNTKKITVRLKNAPLAEVLKVCFEHQPLTFTIVDKTIVVKQQKNGLNKETISTGIDINGLVTDEAGNPLSGASVKIKGTENGVSTSVDGRFTITSEKSKVTLVVSFVGYTSREVEVAGGNIQVRLTRTEALSEEVVVTALGIKRQSRSLVYATQSVKTGEITEIRDANNFVNSLQGKVANAFIVQGSGGPGSGSRIVLRGNKSIQQSNTALIVVDGIPIINVTNNGASSDYGYFQGPDGASNINPDDIESLSVLRGASAAALYGSQAGNGVLVINTKKGGTGLRVSVNSGFTYENAFSLPKFQNTYGQGSGGKINTTVGDSWGAEMKGETYTNSWGNADNYTAQPNNVKDFFRNGSSTNNYISIANGTEKSQSYFSYTSVLTQGIVPMNNLTGHNFNFRINNQLSKKLSTDFKINYINQRVDKMPRVGLGNTIAGNIFQIPRSMKTSQAEDFQTTNAEGLTVPINFPATLASIYQNPYWTLNNTTVNSSRERVGGFLALKYDLTDWLNINGRANLDQFNDFIKYSFMEGTILLAPSGTGGDYVESRLKATQQWYDVILSGKNSIGNNFKVAYNAGAIFRDYSYSINNVYANGLFVPNNFSMKYAKSLSSSPSSGGNQTQSLFAQANLAYKNAVYLDLSVRNDWDSRLSSPYSYAYYSVGLSAVLSDLLKLPDYIYFLKASVNYAEVGNGGQEQIRFATYNYVQGAGNGQIYRSSVYPIENLKPEIVKNTEATIEAQFLKGRFGFSATYYKSNSFNQLISLSVPVATGYASSYMNAGNIQNSGWEFTLTGAPVKSKHFSWNIAANLSFNSNKVIRLTDDIKTIYISGSSIQVTAGGHYGDLYAYTWKRNEKGEFMVNNAGLPIKSTNVEYIGNFNPKALIGLTNTFQYKNFSFRFLIDGRIGGTIISSDEMNFAFSGLPDFTTNYRDGGLTLNGVNANGEKVNTSITAQQFWQSSAVTGKTYGTGEFFAYDGTSIRARELSLSYNIPVKKLSFLKNASISLVGRNLFWIYRGTSMLNIPGMEKRKMWFDPDMTMNNGNAQGLQGGTLPATRSYGVNLKLVF